MTLKLDGSDLSKARALLAPVNTSLNGVQEKLKQVEAASGQATTKAITGLQQMAQASIALAGAFSAGKIFGSFLQESALLAARVEVVNTVLGQVAKNAGISGNAARAMRDEVKALGITTQEASSATTRFIQNQLDLTKVTDLARIAQNAAVVANQNSSEALQGLIHGITTLQPEVLRTYGIIINLEQAYQKFALATHTTSAALTGQQKQQIALNEVIRVGATLAGTYIAAMGDVGKQITSLDRVVEEAQEAFGQAFLPVLRATVPVLGDLLQRFTQLDPLTQSAISSITAVTITIGGLSLAVGALSAAFAGLGIAAFLTSPIGIAVLALGGLAAAILTVKAARDRELEGHRQAVKDLTSTQQAVRLLTADTAGLVRALDPLANNTKRTAEESRTLEGILQVLMQRYPGLRSEIDPTNKSLDEQAKAVQRVTAAITEMEAKAKSLAPGMLRNLLPQPEQFLAPTPGARIPGQPGLNVPDPQQLKDSFELLEPGMAAVQKAAENAGKSFAELLTQVKQLGIMLPTDVAPRLQAVSKLLERMGTEPALAMQQLGLKAPQELQTLKTVLLQEQADLQNKLQNQTSQRIQNETAAAITGANTQLSIVEARFQKEAALLSTAQQKREVAFQQETQAALSAENLTAKQREDIQRDAAIRQLEITRDNSLERIALEKQRVAETARASDAVITAEIARQEQLKRLGPEATASANAQIKELLGQRTSDHAKTSADLVKLDADTAKAAADFEIGTTKVKADEGVKQLQTKKRQLEAEAALRQTTLQGEAEILDAQLALHDANVQSQLGLVQNSMLGEIDIKQKGFQEEARLRDQLFQNRAEQIQNQADREIRLAEEQSRSTVGIQEKADLELEALGIRRQAVMRGLRNQEEQEWRRFVERVQDILSNFLYDIFSGQIKSIKDVLRSLKDFFLRTLADMIAAAVANPIAIVIRSVIGGITGLATQALGATGLAAAGAVAGVGGGGGAGGTGIGAQEVLGIGVLGNQLFGPTSFLGGAVDFFTQKLTDAAFAIHGWFGAGGTVPEVFSSLEASGMISTYQTPEQLLSSSGSATTGATAGQLLGIAGGLAALGGGIYAALNASNNAAKAAYAASAAAGAFAAGAAAYGVVTGAALATAAGTGWTGIGLIVAAVMAVIGVVLDKVIKPAGPSLSVGRPRGLNIVAEEGGQLGVQGDLGTRVTRRVGVDKAFATSVQAQMEEGITNAVLSMVQAINVVALDPVALLGPTQDALQAALAAIKPLNTANAKKMSQDITEQLRFINIQVVSGLLGPLNLAFDQLIDADLEDQLQRLPGTTSGMLAIFKNLNVELDNIAKSENTDVLRQLSSVRNKVEDFGAKIANTAGATAERIVDAMLVRLGQVDGGPTARLDGADHAMQEFDRSLAEQITDLNVLMTTSLQALGTLRGTAQMIDEAGLSSTRIMAQIERLAQAIGDAAARISTEIVTTALGDLTVDTRQVTAQPMGVQPTTVASLYTDSLAALQALWAEWHRLEQAGINASGIQAQWDRLLAGLFESAGQIIDNAFRQGSFSEFLAVLTNIPKALTDLNPTWAKLAQVGQVFAQVVGPIAQTIASLEDELRSTGDRIAITGQRITDLRGAIAQAGDSAEQALPLYVQLAQAIQASGAAQIQAVNEQAEEWNTVARERADAELKIVQQAADEQLKAAQDLADAQMKAAQDAADAQMEALNEWVERSTKAINDWADEANTLASQLSSVNATILGEQSPTVQRQTLEGQKAALEAVVNATGSPEALTELIRVNQQLLGLAKESDDLALLQKSLDELAAIQDYLTKQLVEMTGESDPILAQITVAQAQEQRLQEISDYQETQTKAIQDTLASETTRIQETLASDTTRIQETLAAQTQAIQATLEARLTEVAEWQKNTIAAIKEDMVRQLQLVQYELQKLFIVQYKALTGVDLPPPTALGQQGGQVPAFASLNRAMTGPMEVHHYAAGGGVRDMPRVVERQMARVTAAYATLGVPRFAEGGQVSVKLEPGEGVFTPPFAATELEALQRLNEQIPRFAMAASGTAEPSAHRFGGVVPGTGTGDIVSATVPADSFILNREAMTALEHPAMAKVPEDIWRILQPLASARQPDMPSRSRGDDRWSGPIQFPMERSRGAGGTPGHQSGGSVPGNGGKSDVHHHDNRVIFHLPNLTIRSHHDLEELKRALAELARRGLKR